MKQLKKLVVVFLMAKIFIPAICQGYGPQQLIPAGHWVYDSLSTLCLETKFLSIADNAPLSVKEIKFYLSCIDYDRLSDGGKILYDKTLAYLNQEKFTVNLHPVKIGLNLLVNPTVIARSNDEIEWSFGTDYMGKKTTDKIGFLKTKDKSEGLSESALMTNGYAVESSYTDSEFTKPLLIVPVTFAFDDLFIIETQLSVGKSQFAMLEGDYFNHNILTDASQLDFYNPKIANASFTHVFDSGWGVNLHVARSGLQIGNTETGSVIYNNTFDTNVYFHTELFSRQFKFHGSG